MRLRTWKTSRDTPPMFWVYPYRPAHALQITVWRRKFEFRW